MEKGPLPPKLALGFYKFSQLNMTAVSHDKITRLPADKVQYIIIVTRSKGPAGPGLVWSSLSILETLKYTKQDKQSAMQGRRKMQINAIAICREIRKSKKVKHFFR